jgi:hypothetical protein
MSGGRTDNWLMDKSSFLYRGETETHSTSCQVRKQTKNKYVYTYNCHTHFHVCLHVWLYEERERISVTLVTTATQGCVSDLCMCKYDNVFTERKERNKHVWTCTCACLCQPQLNHRFVCLSVCTCTSVCPDVCEVQYSLNSHESLGHTHSLKPMKTVENAGWQDRQLVVGQIKTPVLRRNSESVKTAVVYTQSRKETKNKYVYTYIHLYVCLYAWLYEDWARVNQRHTRHHRSSRVCEWSLHVCARVLRGHKSGQIKNRYLHTH